ncbi:MAG: sulfotransferase [Limnothrix sp.]
MKKNPAANYMIIGSAKSATTSICRFLGTHPDIFMVKCKEPFFFSRQECHSKGIDWYESLYKGANGKKYRGEGSNDYTMKEVFPEALDRIYDYNPHLKLVYMVRHPISRIESFWLEIRSHDREDVHYDFNRAIKERRDWFVDSCRYYSQILPFIERFGEANVYIGFFEDYVHDKYVELDKIVNFIGASPHSWDPTVKETKNSSESKRITRDVLSIARKVQWLRKSAQIIPFGLKAKITKQFLLKPVKKRPKWNETTRKWVEAEIREDCNKLLSYCGKPNSYWNWEI